MEEDLVEARRRSQRRLQLTFESIIERYSQVADDETDEVDLLTGQVVVDRGYLRSRVTNTPRTVPHAMTTPSSHPGIAAPELARASRRKLFRPTGDVEGDEAGSSCNDVSSDEEGEESAGTVETADEAEDEDGEDALEAEWDFLNDSLDASTLSPALRRLTRRWLSGKSSSQSGLPRSLTFITRKATAEVLGHRPSAERTPTSNSEPEDVRLALSSAAAPLHLPPGPSLSATSSRALVPESGSEDGGDETDLFLHDTGFTSALGHVLASARRRLEVSSRPDQWSPIKAPLPTAYKIPSSVQVPPSPACVRTNRPMNPDWYYEMFSEETADDSGDDALDGTLVDSLPPTSTPGRRPNSSIMGAAPNLATSKRRWVSPDRRGPRMHSAAAEIMDKDSRLVPLTTIPPITSSATADILPPTKRRRHCTQVDAPDGHPRPSTPTRQRVVRRGWQTDHRPGRIAARTRPPVPPAHSTQQSGTGYIRCLGQLQAVTPHPPTLVAAPLSSPTGPPVSTCAGPGKCTKSFCFECLARQGAE